MTLCVEASKTEIVHPLTLQSRIFAAMRFESMKKGKCITKLALSHELFCEEMLESMKDAWQQWTQSSKRLEIGYETFSEQLELVASPLMEVRP